MYKFKLSIFFLTSILTSATLLLALPSRTKASDATFEMASKTEEDYRCFAASLQMQDRKYTILINCQNLLYPVDNEIYTYVLWAKPKDASDSIKLGTLDFGKKTFRAAKPISSLFVTTETNKNVKTPSGKVVIQGNAQPVTFLQKGEVPTPEEEKTGEEKEVAPVTEKQPTTREKLATALKRAGLAAAIALTALVGLIFIVTRSRG